MLTLAVANLGHHKVRTTLSVLAVAIAITLLLVLVGLSHGTLNDVSGRMKSVGADVLVSDRSFDVASFSGGKLWEKEIETLRRMTVDGREAVEGVIPVFMGRMKFAGQSQNVFGVRPGDFEYFAGGRKMVAGRVFEDVASPEEALGLAGAENGDGEEDETKAALRLPVVVDERLARAGGLKVGDQLQHGSIPVAVVGVVETGVAGRVFAPINMLRGANGVTALTAHLFFVRVADWVEADQMQELCERIGSEMRRSATPLSQYGDVLAENFRSLTLFVSLVSVISLVICFLFIVVTIYTSVLERAREIAILQSLGADRGLIMRQTVQESLLLCAAGTVLGVAAALAVRWGVERALPLMTIEMRASWVAGAAAVGIAGGILSAVYPAYVALRHDPVETLSFE